MRHIVLFFISSIMVLSSSCNDPKPSKKIPDVSQIELDEFNFIRFDQKVAQMDTLDIKSSYNKLLVEYPHITDIYFKALLEFKHDDLDAYYNSISELLKAKEIKSLQSMVAKTYKKDDDIKDDLEAASRYLKYYFPDYKTPNFYTYITEFGYQTIIFPDGEQDGIGLGLDMYLSPEFDYKNVDPKNPVFSDYLTRSYNRDHIAKKAFELVVADLIGTSPGKRMIDQMLHNGKKYYIMQQLLPTHSDTIISEYSKDQLSWLNDNELQIWDYFLEKNLVYETNHLKVNKYLNPSPNSPGMPPEAPGRTATYIGWQIIKSYMRKHPETTLPELIGLRDSQKLMELAKYKPKRR